MDQTGIRLLQLMFKPGETICVSPNKFGYHSIPLEAAWEEQVTLVPTPESCQKRGIEWGPEAFEKAASELLTLVALNPINGFRLDANCYRYRNFLLELDTGDLKAQVDYIRSIGVPYSAMVFSGGKSVHTLISLEEDLPSEALYRLFIEWLLNILTLADPLTKNPSRSIRIPGGLRDGDKRQRLIEMKGKVSIADLGTFLNKYEHCRPQPRIKRQPSQEANYDLLAPWVVKQLREGIDFSFGRNKTWFSIACAFAVAGYSEELTVDILTQHFTEERTFKEKEWLTAIRSAFNHIHQR